MVRKLTVFAVLAVCVCLASNSQGAAMNVSSMAELQSALITAESNGQDDTINVAAGHFSVDETLSYVPTECYSITVNGAGMGQTVLDGSGKRQIMSMDTSQTDTDICRRSDLDYSSSVTVHGISFVNGNNADGNGGGMEIKTNLADIIVQNCEFSDNEATPPDPGPPPWPARGPSGGGGLYVAVGVTVSINTPTSGGDVYVQNNLFKSNWSSNGGGAYIQAIALLFPKTEFTNNILDGNAASVDGGGVWIGSDYSFLMNNTVVNSSAGGNGGGLYLFGGSQRTSVFNDIIWANSAKGDGADIYIYDRGTPEYMGIFNNNYTSRFFYYGDSYSEGYNSNEDPKLDENYNPQDGSKCIDSGDNSAPNLPDTDFDGNKRIHNGTVDRGAIESGSSGIPDSPPDPGDSPVGGGSGGGCFIDTIMGRAL